ncbi:MAG TPA: glycoside hydrolase family 15 protein [Actinomycetota bacterium]|nr:glycoside hydrolase family 15 protein [Actinomycetota bacterium]
MDYPLISDHGLIGDLQTAALVSTDGTVDWFCVPRFDSPSVFASLLDAERGGRFRIASDGSASVTKQLYFPDTAALITRFMTTDGVGEVIDFMPIDEPERATTRHQLIRIVRVVRGEMRFVLECDPRFDYGRADHEATAVDNGVMLRSAGVDLLLRSTVPLEIVGNDIRATWTGRAGDVGGAVLESAPAAESVGPIDAAQVLGMFNRTVRFWRDWLGRSTYTGRWREAVTRSAMTLKLMTYAPTGALVAAPTTGLPEQVGGERNWDYRFTWVRDASFSVYALLGLGYTDEAEAFLKWLRDRNAERAGSAGPLKIMYRIDGSPDLQEETLDHLRGYRDSVPVRIGNGASDQLQLDIYGEAMNSVYLGSRRGLTVGHEGWSDLSTILDWLCDNWDRPDEGIWETRGGQKDFTYGRLMSWVAFDRGIRMAQDLGRPANLERWLAERDRIYRQIMDRGWSKERAAFVQHYDSQVLDASNLLMPLVDFIAPLDPMWLSTLTAMDDELVSDSLVYRYDPAASPDGLRGSEGTFSICTFWYVDALARSGRLEEARLTFEKMLTYANHVGLFAEEIGPTGEQLGNFPQAFTHLSLINAAINLDAQLDRNPRWVDLAPRPR